MSEDCFYKDGLYFACKQGCTDCCKNEPGLVFLSDDDIKRIAMATNTTVQEAIAIYTRYFIALDGSEHRVLREYSDNRCVFLSENGCKIYPSRPRQCASYPFWDRVLKSREDWDDEHKFCPGIGDKSALVSYDEIERQRKSFEFPISER